MRQLNLSEARRMLPRLADEVRRSGKTVLLTRRNQPIAVLAPCSTVDKSANRDDLPLRGLAFELPKDFDAPLDFAWKAFRS